jgi:hypothetical protein
MTLRRKITTAAVACFAIAGLAGAFVSNCYLWHLASRVPNPGQVLVHAKVIGTGEEFGEQFTVYLSSADSVLTFQELYFLIATIALLLLLPLLWWKLPARNHET